MLREEAAAAPAPAPTTAPAPAPAGSFQEDRGSSSSSMLLLSAGGGAEQEKLLLRSLHLRCSIRLSGFAFLFALEGNSSSHVVTTHLSF